MIKVLARVEDEAAQYARGVVGSVGFNMGAWMSLSTEQYVAYGDPRSTNVCGTTACLAGHAVLMEGYKAERRSYAISLTDDGHSIEKLACEILGLEPGATPFYCDDLDEVYNWVACDMGIDETVLREKVQAERVFA